ncbi:porin [Burkholderia guangdongensis]|uniref:porin n=1 Tax=Burkholderia guangdongensis TaxID=1792500 RepID=UPI0015C81AEA|nr:porin [Burkholderia guangdongensis]
MQKQHYRQFLLAATLGCASGAVAAQSSVTIYGVIDAGLLYMNRAATAPGSQVQLTTGGISPSIWGFRGVEDLGGGMKAIFDLEGHFSSNSGTLTSGPGYTPEIFRRQANVGLSTPWGTVTLGRQYSPSLLAALTTEPRDMKENLSSLYSWAYTQLAAPGNALGAGTSPDNDVGVFIGNAVQYSNTLGPVWLGAAYSFGGVAGSLKRGSEISLGATYTGPFTVSAAYQTIADSVTGVNVSRLWNAGIAVPYGPVTGKFNYLGVIDRSIDGPDVSNVRSFGAGIDYRWTSTDTTTLAGYYNTYRGAHNSTTRSLVLSNDYFLSKRTTLYAQIAYVDAGAVGTVDPLEGLKTSIVAGGTAAGAKTVLANVGIKHNF